MIITIDGPAGSGKSTVARRLAERLGFEYLDTGAMYRAVAWVCLVSGRDPNNAQAAAAIAESLDVRLDGPRVFVDEREISAQIRSPEVTQAASVVAANPQVRRCLVRLQRQAGQGRDSVCEGRDQGTVVFPDADHKFFLTASLESRAVRRQQELAEQGTQLDLSELIAQMRERDQRDERRDIAPLTPADDAVTIDTSEMSIDSVLDELENLIH